ncbi:sel1 repeat family protein [Xanthomonas sp. AmX2]|uniref:tetratricopeptide repeat protein n=1 Tax=Xanthomonas sp. TaxID=29446 RepID=UPI00197E62CB|nr:tetratricopeptide repeat protein [Xanthomonas sp.]MBN6149099.1 sel1 repeat family protein [Xanthomonas sp.]
MRDAAGAMSEPPFPVRRPSTSAAPSGLWTRAHADVERDAHAAWRAGQLQRAFHLFQLGASAGVAGCQLDLGYFHDAGIGTPVDKAKALYWYRLACRQGDAAAACNIALIYRDRGHRRLMVEWYRRAAALGDGEAAVELARLHLGGHGVRRSLPIARRHLRAALGCKAIRPEALQWAQALAQQFPTAGI